MGQSFLEHNGKKHLVTWTQLDIPDGPSLTLGLTVCSTQLEAQSYEYWRDGLYLGWLLLIFSAIIASFGTERVTRPLQSIESWASRLRSGDMTASMPSAGRILELSSLINSLNGMANQVKIHTRSLEKLVEKRTQELSEANQELERLSLTDSLTNLPNRRKLDYMGQNFWSQAQRNGQNIMLFMMDIDLFKAYNDTYGHQSGDEVLAKVACILNEYARRPADLVARYGGEEFAMIMSNATIEHAQKTANLILKRMKDEKITHSGSPLGYLTISIGISICKPGSNNKLEDLYKQADKALYEAKETGRNRAVFFS